MLPLLLLAVLSQAPALEAGRIVDKVTCPSDPTQSYALYLPAGYTPARRWPLLLVFDPRARGAQAAEIFREAAERFGWIIASSNNTMSDGDWEPNRRALAAMWPDVRAAWAVDERRIYAAGFSGGGGVAWVLSRSGAPLAGIIAAGAPDQPGAEPPPKDVAWFGTAGRTDFNFLQAKIIDGRFAKAGLRRRLEFFDGAHRWLPASLAMRAVAWLEALAMRDGRRPADAELLARLGSEEVVYAAALESEGRLTDAHRAFTSAAATYAGTPAGAAAADRVAAIEKLDDFKRASRDEARSDERERDDRERLFALQALYGAEPPSASELARELGVDRLRNSAGGRGYVAESAARSLETVFVQVSFYVWRDLEQKKQWTRAATSLEVATMIHPDRPRLWFDLAAAHSMARRKGPGLAALKKAIELGFANADALRTDPRLPFLRETAEFGAILAKVTPR